MTVKFYNLKINPQNRFYNKVAYENNINDTNVIETIDLNREIIPNQVFYLKRDNKSDLVKLMGCTYITYEINGTKFGGFITNIQLLAPKGKTIAVYHSVDWWYFTLLNELSFDMHGNCLRAHVNDIDNDSKKFTMDFTVPTQESPLSNYKTKTNIYDLTQIDGLKINNNLNENFAFLYMFTNEIPDNWDAPVDVNNFCQYIGNDISIRPSNGYTFMCVVNIKTGLIYPIVQDYNVTFVKTINFKNIHIKDLQSQAFLNYCISDYYFTDNYNLTLETAENGELFFSHNSNDLQVMYFQIPTTVAKGLPPILSYQFSNITPRGNCFFAKKNLTINDYFNSRVYSQNTRYYDYDNYIVNSIGKFYFEPYQSSKINENIVSFSKLRDTVIKIFLTADLLNYIVIIKNNYYDKTFIVRNSSYFTPDTINDFWTSQNAKMTSLNAKQLNLSAKQAYISGAKKMVNGLLSPIKGFAEGYMEGGFGGAISGSITQTVNAPFDIYSGQTQLMQGGLLEEQGKVMNTIAERQLNDGDISSEICSSYYASMVKNKDVFIYEEICTPIKCIETLIDLHRFGYNTFLQLDEIYKNHQREHFNYFQASDIEITGLPLFIASDLQNMFLSGVHLWTRDIEEFENGTNYQLGLWD